MGARTRAALCASRILLVASFALPELASAEPPPPRPMPELSVLAPVPGGLTSQQVAERAVLASHTVRVKREEITRTNAEIRQTTIQFFPRLTLQASYTRLSPISSSFGSGAMVGAQNPGLLTTGPCPSGVGQCVLDAAGVPVGAAQFAIEYPENNYALNAALVVPLSDYVLRLSHAAASARASRSASRHALFAEKLRVYTEARILYLNWIRAKAQTAITEKALERIRARLSDVNAAYAAGAVSKADVLRMEALLANTELEHHRAQKLHALVEEQLALTMGQPKPSQGFGVGEDLLASVDWPVAKRSLEANTALALRQRAELRTVSQTEVALKRGASAVRALGYPRVAAFGDVTYANPNQRFFPPAEEWHAAWSVGVTASFTLNDAFQYGAHGAELEASARSLEAQRRALSDGIRQEVLAAHFDLERATLAVETTDRAVRAQEEAHRVTSDLYQVGKATTTDLMDAEAELLQVKLAHVNARIEVQSSAFRLMHATGQDTTSKGAAPAR